jgi:hypothetical protein
MLLLVPLSVFAVDFSKVPLPDDLNIVPPDSSLSENIKALSGKRGGVWMVEGYREGIRSTGELSVLVVEKILDEKTAVIVYGTTGSPTTKGGFYRTEAQIVLSGKKVMLEWVPQGTSEKISFGLKKDKLEREKTVVVPVSMTGNFTYYIKMSRIQ